ncbi:MAG: methylmalonyl-CoA mutase family protein [Sphaerobacter thermophilus]|uniref:acyl-CoA mutase large subunit family protein n=1 Tax=Sphaerobacter thermophilus TaxID=2057 RepID=UPI00396D8D78
MAEKGRREVVTDSGIVIEPVYRAKERPPEPDPGEYPFTRGIYPTMYRGRRWTMRQYAGFSSAEETNRRFRLLLERGQTGLSVAFDLPTQLGYDSDHPAARAEVGRVGVAISTLDDMRRLFDGIDLSSVTTSMTINAPASLLLLLYQIVAEEQGVDPAKLGGTIQNDILKEYAARGTYIFPPRPSMRLVTDTFAYCREHLPNWNTISISGYHIREAGATAVQEIAFTLANGIAYVQAALDAGLDLDDFAPRLSFFFAAHSTFFEEVAKFRAARRMWAKIMRERFGAKNPRSWMLRFHTQTGGCTLTAQQPLNNVVRVAFQALAAVLGGTQSLHTNGFDEALALPTEEAATLALRTQQIISEETGVADTADPLGGSYFVETLTDELEQRAWALIDEVEERGGAVAAIESGFIQDQIADSAYKWELAVASGERTVVGVNKYRVEEDVSVPIMRIDEESVQRQIKRVIAYRERQDRARVAAALDEVEAAARGTDNLLPPMKAALLAGATVGEICGRLREVWGEYRPT